MNMEKFERVIESICKWVAEISIKMQSTVRTLLGRSQIIIEFKTKNAFIPVTKNGGAPIYTPNLESATAFSDELSGDTFFVAFQNVHPVKCTIPAQAPATPPATIPTHPVASLASKGVLVRKERCGTTENVSTKTPASLMVCHKKSHYCNPKITE